MLQVLTLIMLQQAPATREALLSSWVAPDGCPTHATATALLREPTKPETLTARVRIDAPRAPKTDWRAVIFTDFNGQTRSRVVDAGSCDEVARAAVLIIDLARTEADSAVVVDVPTIKDVSAVVEDDAEPPAPLPPLKLVEDVLRRPRQPFRIRLRVSPLFTSNVGLFPSPGLGFGVGVSASLGADWRLDLAAFIWIQASVGTSRVEYSLTTGLARVCRLFELGIARLGPCGAVEAGALTARGLRLAERRGGTVGWVAPFLGASAHFDTGSFIHPWASIEAGVNLIRPTFVIASLGGTEVAHQVGFPIGRATVGVELSWQ